ncbi:hypothetical protein O181_057844 [Austropuccinia psidii MF-1]|uniref:Uncharacterized protein n=1 Tax=Austropuccinia psidii MF-1 TaxID=1389203 RepID=A0A9Q3EB72_9BASI|nr:hypothetical protein [Austropuccinia psidii MF-1]
MRYIHGTPTKLSGFIEKKKHPLIMDTEASFSVVTRNYLDENIFWWSTEALPTEANSLISLSAKLHVLGKSTNQAIITHKKGDFRIGPEVLVLENAQARGFILGEEYRRMYGIDICNIKNRNLKFGKEKEKIF